MSAVAPADWPALRLFLQFLFDLLHILFDHLSNNLAHVLVFLDANELEPFVEFVGKVEIEFDHA